MSRGSKPRLRTPSLGIRSSSGLLDACLADFNANRSGYRVLLRPPPSKSAIARLAQWNDDAAGFLRAKLAPLVEAGKLDAETAALLPDVLSAFLDGICVRLVLEDENSVSQLSSNIERFLCRIVDADVWRQNRVEQ